MTDLLLNLVPLIVGSAVVPVHIIITILLVRSNAGRIAAVAWVAGATTFRLLQGLVFGLLFESPAAADGRGQLVSAVLLVAGIAFLVMALKKLVTGEDEDAPPPKWMTAITGLSAGRAYLLGFGLLAIGLKYWVFTLGAIGLIEEAGLGLTTSIVAFLIFVLLAQGILLAVIAVAYLMPSRADAALDRFSGLLTRYNRPIMIVLGLAFGTWFVIKALAGLGVI